MLKSDRKVVDLLVKMGANKWTSTATIAKAAQVDYRTTARALKRLHDNGLVKKRFGPRNTMLYSLSEKTEIVVKAEPTQPTTAVALLGALSVFQVHKRPKFMESGSYKAYAKTVAGLFKQMLDVVYGAAPDQDALTHYRHELSMYRLELEGHLRGIDSILDTPELWDASQSAGFLAGAAINLDELSALVDRALKENQ